ncbi:MAG TPA: hypothetical protein VJS15_07270 [Allosphingosinicella sp.]|nr:hypothetical protein [Allosphingosinicella sp.]
MKQPGLITAAFGARLGAKNRSRNSIIEHLPPLVSGREDMEIDITPLILHGKLIMDTGAFDFITCNRYRKTQRLARQLTDFFEAGLLETHSFSSLTEQQERDLELAITQELTVNRRIWLTEVRQYILEWEFRNVEYVESYGKKYSRELPIPYVILAVLDGLEDASDDAIAAAREAIFLDKTKAQKGISDIAIRSVISHTYVNDLNNERFGAPVYDWDNMQRFLTLHDRIRSTLRKREDEFAHFVVHDLAHVDTTAASPSQLISLLTDRKIVELREFIREGAAEGLSSSLVDAEALNKRLLDYNAIVQRKQMRRFSSRIAASIICGNIPLLGALASEEGWQEPTLKSVDEFLKGAATDTMGARASSPVDRSLRAVYILHKHLPRRQ